ncbi:hypothetical protein GCM10010399_84510 [Dactylosporangium fulvum]|uniref:Glycosyltransferase RgtA/B/C/D-like domain-containing protein n=1 Tax=Dactylosporangium fulvum TaxID=53359 RepID=A0ABY5VT28_9ACTN|nr:hypothetical protein [Dactylosporangium fulvum]UWP79979.1 hypothetical protein Dfulv_33095 [Dactylosporangium fulvum]
MHRLLDEQQETRRRRPDVRLTAVLAPVLTRRWSGRPPAPAVFATAFLTLATLLVLRNRVLFSAVINEGGDSGANSILVLRAKHFDQLVGNYSRIGFNHPGPAFLYVQAFGEWLLHDLLRVVPSPWNGQAVALLVLNAALLAGMLAVLAGWLRSWAAIGLAGAVLLGYAAAVPDPVIAGTWMPLLYFPPFLLLLTAAASVAAGRVDHVWVLGVAGGLLIHGHAEFLFFVPVIVGAAVAVLVRRQRREPADDGLFRGHRRAWLLLAGVLALFALPILVNLVVHWPGEFGKYFGYGSSTQAGGHSPWSSAWYVARFWPGEHPAVRPIVAVGSWTAAVVLTHRLPDGPHRRYLRNTLGIAGLATALFAVYAQFGIDHLSESYIGFFSYALPLLIITVVILAAVELLRVRVPRLAAPRVLTAAAAFALVVGVFAAGSSARLDTPRYDDVPALPATMASLTSRTAGRPVVLELRGDNPLPDPTPLLLAGERSATRICVRDPWWTWIVTKELVCTADEVATGQLALLSTADDVPTGSTVIADLGRIVLSVPAESAPAG